MTTGSSPANCRRRSARRRPASRRSEKTMEPTVLPGSSPGIRTSRPSASVVAPQRERRNPDDARAAAREDAPMTSTFRLGRLAGVEIGVHWSWLIVVALITWSLAGGVFPTTNPGMSDGAYLTMALIAVPVFFATLLLHELGHAVIARREGMEIDGITLWVFGGVARFKGHFPSAGAEFRIAIAGPLVTLVIGVVLISISTAVPLPAAVDG
ncbi:hypothetical protein EPO05_07095, partial [Patescibacteria group bacterium]